MGSKGYDSIPGIPAERSTLRFLLYRLMRTDGQTGKVDAAKSLLRAVAPVFTQDRKIFSRVDSWYMKWPYVEYVLALGFHAMGQIRRGTALYRRPVCYRQTGPAAEIWQLIHSEECCRPA